MDIDSIKDKIRDRIQTEFVELIPKEDWDALVKKEITWFMTNTTGRYSDSQTPSPLSVIVRKQLEERFVNQIREALNEMSPTVFDSNGNATACESVKVLVKEIAPELWEIAVGNVVQRALERFRMNI